MLHPTNTNATHLCTGKTAMCNNSWSSDIRLERLSRLLELLLATMKRLPLLNDTDTMQALRVYRFSADMCKTLLFLRHAMRGTKLGIYAEGWRAELLKAASAWLGTHPTSLRDAMEQIREGVDRQRSKEKDLDASSSASEDEREEVEADESDTSSVCEA